MAIDIEETTIEYVIFNLYTNAYAILTDTNV